MIGETYMHLRIIFVYLIIVTQGICVRLIKLMIYLSVDKYWSNWRGSANHNLEMTEMYVSHKQLHMPGGFVTF